MPKDTSILTKILATLGPATRDAEVISHLIDEGVRVIRINFSHGGLDDFKQTLDQARAGIERSGQSVGILGDLSGPKIRATTVADGELMLKTGDHVEIVKHQQDAQRNPETGVVTISTTYPQMVDEVEPGHRLLINDGAIRMLVTDVVRPTDEPADGRDPSNPRLICSCTVGGKLTPKKGINLPDTDITAPALTDWDRTCAQWAVENGLDFLALSFVRKAEDVVQLKDLLRSLGRDNRELRSSTKLPIVAKIEKPQAMHELHGILDEVDGVMVARGDLGVEMDAAEVPVLQKRIIQAAHEHGKPAIVATQMLESMITNANPTRAEVSDVANAIWDGADAVMLSGETAVGDWPSQAVHVMARTASIAEKHRAETQGGQTRPPKRARESRYRSAALAHGVAVMVHDLAPRYVVMWSELGGGARFLSQHRLTVPILAVSSNPRALRQMALLYGVFPIEMERPDSVSTFLENLDELLLSSKIANPGDTVITVMGEPLGTPGVTNAARIHYIGDVCRLAWHAKDEPLA